MKITKESLEPITIGAILIFILLPVRVLFVSYVNDHWLGSLGIVSLVSFIVLYLAKKDKLGWFGRAFVRQLFKIRNGKRKYIFFVGATFSLLYFGSIIIGVELSNTYLNELQTEVQTATGLNSLVDLNIEPITFEDLQKTFYGIIARPDILIITVGIVNDMTHGYLLHFAIVFVVEELELIGIYFFTTYFLKPELNYLTKQNLSKDGKCLFCKDPFVSTPANNSMHTTYEHLDGNTFNNDPTNLALAHKHCNNEKKHNSDYQIIARQQLQENHNRS